MKNALQDVNQVANIIYNCFFNGTSCSLPASANPFSPNTTFSGYDLSPYCASNTGDANGYILFAQALGQRVLQLGAAAADARLLADVRELAPVVAQEGAEGNNARLVLLVPNVYQVLTTGTGRRCLRSTQERIRRSARGRHLY